MLAPDDDAAVPPRQHVELHQHAHAASRRRRHRRARDAEAWKRAEAENQTRIEHDVDRVRDPQHAHRNRRIAGAAKNRVDEKQREDDAVEAENDARVQRVGEDARRRAHHPQQRLREREAGQPDWDRDEET